MTWQLLPWTEGEYKPPLTAPAGSLEPTSKAGPGKGGKDAEPLIIYSLGGRRQRGESMKLSLEAAQSSGGSKQALIRLLIACFLVLASSMSSMSTTSAYVFNPGGCRWSGSSPSIWYNFLSVTAPYQTATSAAAGAWNATSAPGAFFKAPTGQTVNVWVYDNYYGLNGSVAWVSGSCGSNDIWNSPLSLQWNQTYLDDDTASLKQAVGVHEFGHVYGLWETTHSDCHNQVWHGAMMRGGEWAWTTCGWNTPKVDDVAGVDAIY